MEMKPELSRPSAPPAIPEPLEDWIAVVVGDLAPESEAQLRAEYTSHISDAIDQHLSEGKAAAKAVEETLCALGSSEIVRRQLRRTHLTKADFEFIEERKKQAKQYGWPRRTGKLAVLLCWALWLWFHSPSLDHIYRILIWFIAGLVMSEIYQECAKPDSSAALAARIIPMPFTWIALANLSIWTDSSNNFSGLIFEWIVIFIFASAYSIDSIRSLLLILKLRRIKRLSSGDPECRA